MFYTSTATIMWRRNIVRESFCIYIFFGGDPFYEVVLTVGEHTRGADRFSWVTSWSFTFAWVASRCLPSVQNHRSYIVFSGLMRKYEHPLHLTHLFMASYRNLHTSGFFPISCWSYLRTKISVILSRDNKLYFSLSCEPTMLMLSCDCIGSDKFIVTSWARIYIYIYNIYIYIYIIYILVPSIGFNTFFFRLLKLS